MAKMTRPKGTGIHRKLIEEAIETAVRNNFGEGIVASVEITFDEDDFDLDVVNVAVILNRPVEKTQISGFGLKLRNALDKLNSEWFPLVSFIAKNEYNRRRAG
jgi:hypothetical protein